MPIASWKTVYNIFKQIKKNETFENLKYKFERFGWTISQVTKMRCDSKYN